MQIDLTDKELVLLMLELSTIESLNNQPLDVVLGKAAFNRRYTKQLVSLYEKLGNAASAFAERGWKDILQSEG
jgi:hypothetical protein